MPNDASRPAAQAGFVYAFATPGHAQPIVVQSDYAVEPYLRLFLINWPFERLPGGTAAPQILLRQAGQRVAVELANSKLDALDAMSELDGVNCLADLLSHVAASRQPELAELHASSVLVDGKLILFVGPSLSGKSSLALQLAARGYRIFSDDRLLIGPLAGASRAPIGMALGLTPRVRRPPHPAAGALFAEFVARHVVKGGGNVGFLPLDGRSIADAAETAPLGALVLPERQETGGVVLRPAGAAAASRVMLEQMHAPDVAAVDFLAAIRRLTQALPAWHLQYDDSAKAALAAKDLMAG